ncbi:MAG: acyl-CoA dehydrogenase family protein, partial [Pseudomonadota bacterium]|nr:acyl-CoA dehydrogenase family protein [Pseudomonadota bacterium]
MGTQSPLLLAGLADCAAAAVAGLDELFARARAHVAARVCSQGEILLDEFELSQHVTHGLAWFSTYVETLRALAGYVERLLAAGRLGELEGLLVQSAFAEYLDQILGGIPMNQGEFVRPDEFGISRRDGLRFAEGAASPFLGRGSAAAVRARVVALMCEADGVATFGDCALDDTLDRMRAEMRRFADASIRPIAHDIHRSNGYVPLELIGELARLGVFALTVPESYGGMGLGKVAM